MTLTPRPLAPLYELQLLIGSTRSGEASLSAGRAECDVGLPLNRVRERAEDAGMLAKGDWLVTRCPK
jgi:hypothetical protein